MRKIIYTLSAAAIALTAMTVDASARKDRYYENSDRNHYKVYSREKKAGYSKSRKTVKTTVVHKRGGKKIVKRTVTIIKKPKYARHKTNVQSHGKYSHNRYRHVDYKRRKAVYKKPRVVYVRPVVVRHQPWDYQYQTRRHQEPSLPVLAMRLVLKLTQYQLEMQHRAMARAASADVGEQIAWNDNGQRGTVTTTREGTDSQGRVCREFKQTIEIGDNYETGYGIACQNRDGDWDMLP